MRAENYEHHLPWNDTTDYHTHLAKRTQATTSIQQYDTMIAH